MNIVYKLDGVDIATYGVHISASDGLLSKPNFKKPTAHSWPEYHGEVVDLGKRVYDPRVIQLDCFIVADSKELFLTKCNTFLSVFDKSSTLRLSVAVDPTKPLLYEVYLDGEMDIKKVWNDGQMTGQFTIKLREPEPVKRVIKYTRTSNATKTVTLTITSPRLVNIYWGDGNHTFDVSGTSQVVTHNYTVNGDYYIVITGNIDEISSLTHNGTLVWSKL